MKKAIMALLTIVMLVALTACACKHEWQEATCDLPKTCTLCEETEGEKLDHVWESERRVCTLCGLDERSVDEKFMESLAAGLEARWVLTDSTDSTAETTKSDWQSYFDAEYNEIIEYDNAVFEDPNLGKWAQAYIDSIIKSQETLAYYGTNQWTAKYSNGVYHERCVALYEIHAICPIPVSDETQDNLLGLLNDGEVIKMVNGLFEQVQFEEVSNEYGWVTYQAVVENTTSIDFEHFAFDVDLIDADGVTLTTQIAAVDNWQSGEKIRFEFYTDEVFAEMEVESASWYF